MPATLASDCSCDFSQSDVELMQFGTLKMMMAQQIRTETLLEVGSSDESGVW